MRSLFCYGPQVHAARALLEAMGVQTPRVVPTLDGDILRGLEGATFVRVINHPDRVPEEIERQLLIYGLMTIDLSDEYLRIRRSFRREAV